jgi:hypothetical protein
MLLIHAGKRVKVSRNRVDAASAYVKQVVEQRWSRVE